MAQTDNSYLADKVALRAGHLPDGGVCVLDCFAGRGLVWEGVRRQTGRDIEVLPIDVSGWGFHLPGDNVGYLETMDLSRFNVVDLDAYGIPYRQLEALFRRGYSGMVFVTFIQVGFGRVNFDMLCGVGFTREMIEKCPTLFSKEGWAYFLEWIAAHGVRRIWHRSKARKHYLCFRLGAA